MFERCKNNNNHSAVLGCAWGDEAKAKIVDFVSNDYDIIVRFAGGANAGHTVVIGDKKFVMHLIPSGIFNEDKICILSSGVVLDYIKLEEEMEALEKIGVDFNNRLFLDERINILLHSHCERDAQHEDIKNSNNGSVGTTKRGIGPCYADSINRIGIRICDLDDIQNIKEHILIQNKVNNFEQCEEDINELSLSLYNFYNRISHRLINIPYYLNDADSNGKKILFEGAQGSLLDIYYGTYPYVTSSHTISGGISVATGFPMNKIPNVMGVFKSYFTRVGAGPFPTEQDNAVGELIRKQGNEYGSTTGRPRRCGWFDLVAAKYTTMLNGLTEFSLTLVDVLSGIDELMICTHYDINGVITDKFPSDIRDLEIAKPIYESLPGWSEDISMCKSWRELPDNCRGYIGHIIYELNNLKLKYVSVGPERSQTIVVPPVRIFRVDVRENDELKNNMYEI